MLPPSGKPSGGGGVRPLVTSPGGDTLNVSDVVVGSFNNSDWQTEYVSPSTGAALYENCETPLATYGGSYVPFCAEIALSDAETGSETTTDNSASIDIYDVCSDLVADGTAYGAHIIGTDYMTSADLGGEPVTLPTSGVCFGEWTATYTYTQTFHDGDELSASASATFEVTGSQEVSLDGYVTPADPDPSVPCECRDPVGRNCQPRPRHR